MKVKELIKALQQIENQEQEVKIQTYANDKPVDITDNILDFDGVVYITE